MNKGQIFSIDFLFAMVLMIFFLGMLIGLGEMQNYEKKEQTIRAELETRTQAALITLTNSNDFTCKTDLGTHLAYSIDLSKLIPKTNIDTKNNLGLKDYNLSILLDNIIQTGKDDAHFGKNIYAFDINILQCNGIVNFSDINNCMNDTCSGATKQAKLTIKVSK